MAWKILVVFFVSMVPLIELRGAIPIGVALGLELPEWAILLIALIGNIIPVPFIYLFARKILNWGKECKWHSFKKFSEFCLIKGEKAGSKLMKAAGKYSTFVALFFFVAIPIPGTGAWTGTLAASILNLNFKKTVIAITFGVLAAGIIMLLISLGLFGWVR